MIFFQTVQQEHELRRRRGKGEASFLRCKSLGREDVMNRGRSMKGEKEAKRGERERRGGLIYVYKRERRAERGGRGK